jgi:hypothetical protein
MADALDTPNKLVPGNPSKAESEALDRLAAARTFKAYNELDYREAYFFAMPNRQRQISSMTAPSQQRLLDAPELNTDQAFVITGDFVTELLQAFMPEALPWCERGPGMDIPDGIWEKIKDQVKKDDLKIFAAMKASNLYPELTKAFYPDIAIGTSGLWIDRPHPVQAAKATAVPLRELEVNLGPYGEIDDRFAVRYTRHCYVRELVGEEIWAKVPAKLKEKIEGKPAERVQVVWGFWRLWEQTDDECWQHVVLIAEKLVHQAELKGEGCCPLLVQRFNPTADWPHGVGPLIQGLPTLRQIDELERLRIQHSSLSINPPITYPDDSFAQVEQGVEEGMAYPIRPGTEKAVQAIYTVPPPEAANYQYQEKVSILRKLFFVDHPEQTGDTPPTATQWMDELARAQRRLGTPGLSFWKEGPAQIFLRFKYLLEAAGSIKPIKVDGRAVATLPRNPAQAAAEQQDIVKAMQMLTWSLQTFPEEAKVSIDGDKTMKNIIKKGRIDLIEFRSDDQKANAIAQMKQLLGGQQAQGSPEQVPGAGGGLA